MRPREQLEQDIQSVQDKQFNLSYKVSMCAKVKYPQSPEVQKSILATIPGATDKPSVRLPRYYTEQEAARIRRFITQEKFQR